jgi:hypothetical protein
MCKRFAKKNAGLLVRHQPKPNSHEKTITMRLFALLNLS